MIEPVSDSKLLPLKGSYALEGGHGYSLCFYVATYRLTY